jgi:anti-anti-sigma factor
VLCIEGEVDAANADRVSRELRRFAQLKTPLILDLSHLEFLGTAGFQVLLALNDERHKARLHCSVIAGRAMRPLQRIVSSHGLPIVDSVPEALQLIEDAVRASSRHLELVRRSG